MESFIPLLDDTFLRSDRLSAAVGTPTGVQKARKDAPKGARWECHLVVEKSLLQFTSRNDNQMPRCKHRSEYTMVLGLSPWPMATGIASLEPVSSLFIKISHCRILIL